MKRAVVNRWPVTYKGRRLTVNKKYLYGGIKEMLLQLRITEGQSSKQECFTLIKEGQHEHFTHDTLVLMLDLIAGKIKSKGGAPRRSITDDMKVVLNYEKKREAGMNRKKALEAVANIKEITISTSAIEKILTRYHITK